MCRARISCAPGSSSSTAPSRSRKATRSTTGRRCWACASSSIDVKFDPTRRTLVGGLLLGLAGAGISRRVPAGQSSAGALPDLAPFQTPYKYGKLVLEKSGVPGSFDEKSVDCPFVFTADGRFHMTYVGYDGNGYQTGLASSEDLVHWQRAGLILARDPGDAITRDNIALMCILREDA